jgi:inner membrane protein involved in colicin E2 resistance
VWDKIWCDVCDDAMTVKIEFKRKGERKMSLYTCDVEIEADFDVEKSKSAELAQTQRVLAQLACYYSLQYLRVGDESQREIADLTLDNSE